MKGETKMKFSIFDVGHGFCAYAVADDNNVMLIDCGHKTSPEYRPSEFLPASSCTGIEWFVVTNYDEDHISDLPNLRGKLPITVLVRNRTISANDLRSLKEESGPITNAMENLLDMISRYTEDVKSPPTLKGISWRVFSNGYRTDFEDTNNLSLVLFLEMRGLHVAISGDLEVPGWERLLKSNHFIAELGKVNVFVASHHGRENGYCEDVFNHCFPDVIIFSDSAIAHATQDMSDKYASHAKGITFNGERRKVLSTRKDGTLTWYFDDK
jgi:beta-lactamase superfamily II metal-dependent hydrolase